MVHCSVIFYAMLILSLLSEHSNKRRIIAVAHNDLASLTWHEFGGKCQEIAVKKLVRSVNPVVRVKGLKMQMFVSAMHINFQLPYLVVKLQFRPHRCCKSSGQAQSYRLAWRSELLFIYTGKRRQFHEEVLPF